MNAGDGGSYSQAHARYHGHLRRLVRGLGFNDLLLISAHDASICYTIAKEIDIGTDLVHGPFRDTGCVFRSKLDTESGRNWTVIPGETGQRFQRQAGQFFA